MRKPQYQTDAATIADTIIDRVGPDLVLALPLGLGKANRIANALYDRVSRDTGLSLTILTALTLEKPEYRNGLHRRFLEPAIDRLFGNYPWLLYAGARHQGRLPANIRVEEFFFLAGSLLMVPVAQQNHICANYTHALGYLLERGVNVLAQMVAVNHANPSNQRFSASCNADLTADMLAARHSGRADFVFVGEVNEELPFMGGDALLPEDEFDLVFSGPDSRYSLYAPPRMPVSTTDYAAALHVSRLVPDGGTLQIGIGSLGDAVAYCLGLRHLNNVRFRKLVEALTQGMVVSPFDELAPFAAGLHGLSEMLVEGFLHLYDVGVLAREVDGKVLNAAFFLGSRDFYGRLRDLDDTARNKIAMRSIFFTNEVFSQGDSKRMARVGGRFINKAMLVTLRGEVVSDALEDGRVVSGVGGQFDFAVQAFALDDARSVIVVPATRKSGGRVESNIHWSYGNTTVPRHLRDIVVTEYGIADLRGKTDADVIAAMLSVADSRYQAELLAQAKSSGKIASDYVIPERFLHNTPERIEQALRIAGKEQLLPDYPLGTEFTKTEQELLQVLAAIEERSYSRKGVLELVFRGVMAGRSGMEKALSRMDLTSPRGMAEWLQRWLLLGGNAVVKNK